MYIIVTNSSAVFEIYMVARYLSLKGRKHLVVRDFWRVTLVYYVMWQLSGVGLHYQPSCSSHVAPEPVLSGETCTISTVSDSGTCCECVQMMAFHSQHTTLTSV